MLEALPYIGSLKKSCLFLLAAQLASHCNWQGSANHFALRALRNAAEIGCKDIANIDSSTQNETYLLQADVCNDCQLLGSIIVLEVRQEVVLLVAVERGRCLLFLRQLQLQHHLQ